MTSRAIHHVDLWVDAYDVAVGEWGWLLGECGWELDSHGDTSASWVHTDGTYLFLQAVPEPVGQHDRMRPGINHLAFVVPDRELLDRMRGASTEHGWHELFADRYPHAGGEDHTALYLESSEGVEVELVVGE